MKLNFETVQNIYTQRPLKIYPAAKSDVQFNFSPTYSKARFHIEVSSWISIRNTQILLGHYDKIIYGLFNFSHNCDVKSGLSVRKLSFGMKELGEFKVRLDEYFPL